MGGGIAREIATRYPAAEEADKNTEYGSRAKLGNFSYALVQAEKSEFTIINAYTQYKWSGYRDVFEYSAFETFLNRLCSFLKNHPRKDESPVKVGFPKIGCGLAGGNEKRILSMLERFSKDVSPWAEVTLVTLWVG